MGPSLLYVLSIYIFNIKIAQNHTESQVVEVAKAEVFSSNLLAN